MMDSRSVPRLVTLLSESLLSGASCDADEKCTRTRSLSRLAYTTLLGLNQVNLSRHSSAHLPTRFNFTYHFSGRDDGCR